MTQTPETGTIWVTQEAFDRLQQELDHLRGDVRSDITAKIAAAREEGDLKENGGYHAAREEQGKVEARIRQLEDMLRRAEVGEAPEDDGKVEEGMVITIQFEGDDETQEFLLGSRELLSLDSSVDLQVFSPTSPLGKAILDHSAGESVTYPAPNGKDLTVKILSARPY